MYNLAIKAFFFSQTSEDMEVFILIGDEGCQRGGECIPPSKVEVQTKSKTGDGEERGLSRGVKVETEGPGRRDIGSMSLELSQAAALQ